MHRTSTIFPILLLAFAISLSSCVNEVKNSAKAKDTLARLMINYNIPDSNNILAVNFNALLIPPWKSQYRIDWNFGDSTGMISKFDTSILTHYYKDYGSHLVSLSIVDTITKQILGKTSIILDLQNNAIDTSIYFQFNKVRISFSGSEIYTESNGMQNLNTEICPTDKIPYLIGSGPMKVFWSGKNFTLLVDTITDFVVHGHSYKAVYYQSIHGKLSNHSWMLDSVSDLFDSYTTMDGQFTQNYKSQSIVANTIPFLKFST